VSWIKELVDPGARRWEEFYRNRWQYDTRVRSTHGNNCTGGCSWWVYVKNGVVTWEMQATDYPRLAGVPPHEPRGCQRGISYSWYVYSPVRVKYPYVRGRLLDLWRAARGQYEDPVEAWAAIVQHQEKRTSYQTARGKGGFRRASWDECLEIIAASLLYTAREYGPDRVVGFSPIPAMSMVSYAAGSRFLGLFGASILSFYDLYADLPPASPETWGEKTDVAESADWYNSELIVTMGNNLNMTRTPDAHFAIEARNRGAQLVVLSPDFSQVSTHADWWLPLHPGTDGAFWMAVDHVILKEYLADRQTPYFVDYLRRFSDAPFLVELQQGEGGAWLPGPFLRAGRLPRYAGEENPDWKLAVFDQKTREVRVPQGSIGFRWQEKKGQWNLNLLDAEDMAPLEPQLTFLDDREGVLLVGLQRTASSAGPVREVPVRYVATSEGGRVPVTTVLDLLFAQFGVGRGLGGDYPDGYDDASAGTPAWQEPITGLGRETVIRFARQWASTAERTQGKCNIIVGSGANHWYHSNLVYRSAITALVLCGCVGVNGGGLNHYTGQEKLVPEASWSHIAFAADWVKAARLQNAPSYHYVHSDQWRYDGTPSEPLPATGPLARRHTMDFQFDAVWRGWLPFFPQFDVSPVKVVEKARAAGAESAEELADWVADGLQKRTLRFAVQDPDAPENWPRVWMIWRGNALLASAKGHEYFLRHYLGTTSMAIAEEQGRDLVEDVVWRDPAPEGKLDLVVDLNFRMDTSALYSDIVLPSAGWYEKDDLNTTDLHSFIHPMGQAVPPCWESRDDWDIFRDLAQKLSEIAPRTFSGAFEDLVTVPLLHNTPDELRQPAIPSWWTDGEKPRPGKNMPHLVLVERDYSKLHQKFISLGPLTRQGLENRGVHMKVDDLYDEWLHEAPVETWDGQAYPSLAEAKLVAETILAFGPETNGEVAYRGFEDKERQTGLQLVDLAEPNRNTRYDFLSLVTQPRRILTSPCWSGIINRGRPYSAFTVNIERGVPWHTLSGRQHLYLDHPGYRAFGESLPVYRPKLGEEAFVSSTQVPEGAKRLVLNYLTPHGKWHIHTTYSDNLRMLNLSRGINPFWLSEVDAAELGIEDNDWIEAYNDNGVVVTRAIVSARIPPGTCILYHAFERTVEIPRSPLRGGQRAGGHNSLTRMRLKPLLMVGGYAQHSFNFNEYGPPAADRDSWTLVRRLPGEPDWT